MAFSTNGTCNYILYNTSVFYRRLQSSRTRLICTEVKFHFICHAFFLNNCLKIKTIYCIRTLNNSMRYAEGGIKRKWSICNHNSNWERVHKTIDERLFFVSEHNIIIHTKQYMYFGIMKNVNIQKRCIQFCVECVI